MGSIQVQPDAAVQELIAKHSRMEIICPKAAPF